MRYTTLTVLFMLCCTFTLNGCQGTFDPGMGFYNYRAYDQSGNLVVVGILKFTQLDQEGVEGAWQMQNTNGAGQTGIHESFGRFEGSLKGDALYIDLNPGWADNNVVLSGQLGDGRYRGDWAYVGYPGVISDGKFEAQLD